MTREIVLENAKNCVCGQREQDYGTPEDNFKRIGNLWSAYTGIDISSKDVAIMMILMKTARAHGEHCTEDTLIDIAGYAACAGELV